MSTQNVDCVKSIAGVPESNKKHKWRHSIEAIHYARGLLVEFTSMQVVTKSYTKAAVVRKPLGPEPSEPDSLSW